MRYASYILVCWAVLCATTLLSGCPTPEPAVIQVEPVSVTLTLGDTRALTVTSTDERDKTFLCTPGDPLVARGDSDAVVHAVGLGQTALSVTGRHSGGSATIGVTVVPPADFSMQLPADPAQVEPTLERTVTLENVDCSLHFPGVAAEVTSYMQDLYHRLSIPGASRTQEPGKPELPFYTLLFAVPVESQSEETAQWNITVTQESKRLYDGVFVYPAQSPPWLEDGEGDYPRPGFVRDEQVYASNSPYPAVQYEESSYQMGNMRMLEVRVYPVRYLPAKHRLVLSRDLRVQVQFGGKQALKIPPVLGDYKALQETGAEQWLVDDVVNGSQVPVIEADDLSHVLASVDPIHIMDDPFDLLIITRPELFNQARRLARWRQDTGTRVYLAALSESSYPDAPSIRDFIIGKDSTNIVPTTSYPFPRVMSAVLIFGDAEIIPPNQGMNVRGAEDPDGLLESVDTVETDQHYAAIRGGDALPDVAIGRISVDTPDEAEAVVDKIIQYEGRLESDYPAHAATYGYFDDLLRPVGAIEGRLWFTEGSTAVRGTGTSFLGTILPEDYIMVTTDPEDPGPIYQVASVTSNTEMTLTTPYAESPRLFGDEAIYGRQDGRDDWEFIKGVEKVRGFLSDRGVTVRFGYTRNGGVDPIQDFNGEALAPDLLTYAWDADYEDIQANWREGLEGLIVHCDHGYKYGWVHPAFSGGNPPAWDPGQLVAMDDPATAFYPIVFSLNCDSGWFDNETDIVKTFLGPFANTQTGPRQECFCERALRYPEGGAVAIVGAIRGGDADANDRLLDGLMAALYPDFAEGSINPWEDRPVFERLGAAYQWAKFHQTMWLGTDVVRAQYNQEIYHLLGDPMLKMRPPGS
ncbi:MAG: hypothetical protein IT364_15460 [Candidatus Hydrogenedentes bacterium]|nr:hypothetical protein [Candidatus Hydrogenedentota bacterium]